MGIRRFRLLDKAHFQPLIARFCYDRSHFCYDWQVSWR